MLHLFLDKKISADDLTNWAGFIGVRAEYGSPNYLDDEMADYYEDMFYGMILAENLSNNYTPTFRR